MNRALHRIPLMKLTRRLLLIALCACAVHGRVASASQQERREPEAAAAQPAADAAKARKKTKPRSFHSVSGASRRMKRQRSTTQNNTKRNWKK